ncbi:hypothetical protein ERHA54_24700 [Erwinia rhapontici]|uniref:FAD-dependent oxidoreductase n=1 Tax=Erwinia rhapontici TaxID=55212 RepID=UPI001BB3EBC7|nr:FAD-dependent oxidoreductase [Erwinia rhapontici]BCQ39867.1 hypothetical protein ERHA54_24700 [Erwinia rhapontici]
MKEQHATEVLICGAGAAGLTLAIDLARRGVDFRLIEKKTIPFHGSRGKGIQPRTLEIFEDLGIIEGINRLASLYPPERRYHPDGSQTEAHIVEQRTPSPAEPWPHPLMLPQYLTEQVMRERLAELGHQVEFGCELLGFEQDPEGVTARIQGQAGEETLRVQWLTGADGGKSDVRHALNISFPGKTLGVRALVADVLMTGLERDVWHRFGDGDRERQIAFCPLAATDLFQIQGPLPLEGEVDLSAEGLQSLITARTGRKDIHLHAVSWASAYSMNARLAARYQVGRVFLIGDAAHIHPPTGGQGLNTSVQDAYNLGWKLHAVIGGASASLLDSYEQERRPVAAAMLDLSTQLLSAAQQGDLRRGREVHQLDLGYCDPDLALEMPARTGGVHAGDRAPDAPLLRADGQRVRAFELYQGAHWTLIGYQAARHIVQPRPGLNQHIIGMSGDLIDDGNHFLDAYAPAAGDWLLVRPDGYIGAIIVTEQLSALEEYLTRVGLSASLGLQRNTAR